MNITIEWQNPVELVASKNKGMIYKDDFIPGVTEECGVYIFSRKHGETYTPIYIGKGIDLRRRLKQQMNNLKLIGQVKHWHPDENKTKAEKVINGKRMLLIGHVKVASAANKEKAIALAEKGLIEYALSNGIRLLNVQGTVIRHHEVYSDVPSGVYGFASQYLYIRS